MGDDDGRALCSAFMDLMRVTAVSANRFQVVICPAKLFLLSSQHIQNTNRGGRHQHSPCQATQPLWSSTSYGG